MTFKFTPLALAAYQAFKPTATLPNVEVDPAPGNAALAVIATALTSADAVAVTEVGGRHEKPANVENSIDSRAGELAVGASEARPDDQALRNRKLAVLVGSRIVAARELSGVQQFEFSRAIGHKTPAQPSLWESGRRLLPLADVPTVARALGVSSDFLLGLSDEPERDPAVARRALLVGHLRDQLDAVAGHLADAALQSGAEIEGAMRATGLLSKVVAMQNAVQRFEAANASSFDDLPCGALLRRAARELGEAAIPVGAELDAAGLRRERAARLAKMAMSASASFHHR